MEAVLECCVGLDVHQETVVACVIFGPLEHGCFCPSPRKGGIRKFDRAIGVCF